MRPSETTAEQGAACGSWVGFLIRHCVAGMLAGWTAVGGLLWLNTAGLGDLVMSSDLFPLPLVMLLAGFGITFGSVALGSAIMTLGRSGDAAGAARSALVRPGRRAAPRRIDRPL